MSVVTSMIINVGYMNDDYDYNGKGSKTFDAVNELLRGEGFPPFNRTNNDHAWSGGNKSMQCEIWAGAFNHFRTTDFLSAFFAIPWESPNDLQVMVMEEDDNTFTIHTHDSFNRAETDLSARLRDAEATIAKIGFCDPAPHEARERYERKYGSVSELEPVTVKR